MRQMQILALYIFKCIINKINCKFDFPKRTLKYHQYVRIYDISRNRPATRFRH